MRKVVLFLLLLCVPISLFAQDPDWRNRRAARGRYDSDNTFELTPFIGYRYGGSINADQTNLFNTDVSVASHMNYGAAFGIPVANGWKVELSVDRQDTNFTEGGGGLFNPTGNIAGFHITYYQAGVQIPFNVSRSAQPYFLVGAGVASLDPDVPGVSTDTRFSAHAGIGIKVPIDRNMGFRLEEKGYYTSLGGANNGYLGRSFGYNHDLYQGETNFGMYFKF